MIQYKSLTNKEEKTQILADFKLFLATELQPKLIFREFFDILEHGFTKNLNLKFELIRLTRIKFELIRGV